MTPRYNVCSCTEWLPNYDGSLICYHCKSPLSKEQADIASSFWQNYKPSDFYEDTMYNVTTLDGCFKKWLRTTAWMERREANPGTPA